MTTRRNSSGKDNGGGCGRVPPRRVHATGAPYQAYSSISAWQAFTGVSNASRPLDLHVACTASAKCCMCTESTDASATAYSEIWQTTKTGIRYGSRGVYAMTQPRSRHK